MSVLDDIDDLLVEVNDLAVAVAFNNLLPEGDFDTDHWMARRIPTVFIADACSCPIAVVETDSCQMRRVFPLWPIPDPGWMRLSADRVAVGYFTATVSPESPQAWRTQLGLPSTAVRSVDYMFSDEWVAGLIPKQGES